MSDPGAKPRAPLDEVSTLSTPGGVDGQDNTFEALLKEVVRDRPEPTRATLAVGTVLADRFSIDKVLGEGGMGTVYAATDRSLARRVAIKVHHAAGGGVRLRREAVAMARLAHPNVVTVFEVDELPDGRQFVVMELVTGTTLRAWMQAQARTVPEILAVARGIGAGLAAAHDAGLIHRDIKPDNILIGDDGRPRVGDFGLARDQGAADEDEPASDTPPARLSANQLLSPMTRTGAILGTPAYMAPEQATGGVVDARTDQFAFCVTLWEALWGERPYGGANTDEIVASLLAEPPRRREPPAIPKVPARVRAAIERGLARSPDARWPSLHALIAELHPPNRRRVLAIAGGATVVAGAAIAIVLANGRWRDPAAACSDLPPPASPAIPELAGPLTEATRTACVARARGAWTPEIADKADGCLASIARLATIAERPSVSLRARERARVHDCTDPAHLAAAPVEPADPDARAALADARARVRLTAASSATTTRAALDARLAELARSPAAKLPEIASALVALRAYRAAIAGDLKTADTLYADAYYAARAADDPEVTLLALSGLVDDALQLRADRATANQWLRIGIADAERMRARAPWFAAGVFLMEAEVADQLDDKARALAAVTRARALLDPDDAMHVELDRIEGDARAETPDAAIAVFEHGLALAARQQVEPELVALLMGTYAATLVNANRTEQALALADRERTLIATLPDGVAADNARVNLAATLLSADRDDEAEPLLEQARRNTIARYGEHNAIVANIEANLGIIADDRGDHAGALARYREVLAIQESLLGPDAQAVGTTLYSMTAALGALGRFADARETARRMEAIFAARIPGSQHHHWSTLMLAMNATKSGDPTIALAVVPPLFDGLAKDNDPQSVAWGFTELGRAHAVVGRKAEARVELGIARALYTLAAMPARLAELDQLDVAAR